MEEALMRRFAVLLAMAALVVPVAYGQGFKDAKKTLQAGNWAVLRDKDPMTDKISCTGIYKGDYAVQLSDEALYVRVQGGIEAVTLRFNDEAPRPMRLAQEMEKKIRAVIFSGTDYMDVIQAKRLRYQVMTLVSGVKQGDLDLTGIDQAYLHIKNGCPEK
jgi:hypothetical protein